MKKLIICHGYYGHLELGIEDKVIGGKFDGLSQKEMFIKIVEEGYGKNIPAIFHAEYKDGSTKVFKGGEAKNLINDDIEEVTVIAPIIGG